MNTPRENRVANQTAVKQWLEERFDQIHGPVSDGDRLIDRWAIDDVEPDRIIFGITQRALEDFPPQELLPVMERNNVEDRIRQGECLLVRTGHPGAPQAILVVVWNE